MRTNGNHAMKRSIIRLSLALATALLTGCVTDADVYRAELKAHEASFDVAFHELNTEFDARLAKASDAERPAIHAWYRQQVDMLYDERQDQINDTFARWRSDAYGN